MSRYQITSSEDNGPGTLRDAIENSPASLSTIHIELKVLNIVIESPIVIDRKILIESTHLVTNPEDLSADGWGPQEPRNWAVTAARENRVVTRLRNNIHPGRQANNGYEDRSTFIIHPGGKLSLERIILESYAGTPSPGSGITNGGKLSLKFVDFLSNKRINNSAGLVPNDSLAAQGGAIWNQKNGYADIKGCNFLKNTSSYRGGAIFNQGLLRLHTCKFDGNRLQPEPANAYPQDNQDRSHNHEKIMFFGGGAIFNGGGEITLISTTITNNIANFVSSALGAGICSCGGKIINGGNLLVVDNEIYNNQPGNRSMYFATPGAENIFLTSTTIHHNLFPKITNPYAWVSKNLWFNQPYEDVISGEVGEVLENRLIAENCVTSGYLGIDGTRKDLWRWDGQRSNYFTRQEIKITSDGNLIVENLLDNDYPGSLRYIINRAPNNSTIVFNENIQGNEIKLNKSELGFAIKKNIVIDGKLGNSNKVININNRDHLFYSFSVENGAVLTLANMTFDTHLTYHDHPEILFGDTKRVVINNSGTLILVSVEFKGCRSTENSSAISNLIHGTVIATDCSFENCRSGGKAGAIYNVGRMYFDDVARQYFPSLPAGKTVIKNCGGDVVGGVYNFSSYAKLEGLKIASTGDSYSDLELKEFNVHSNSPFNVINNENNGSIERI